MPALEDAGARGKLVVGDEIGSATTEQAIPLNATLSLGPGEITGDTEVRGQTQVSLTAPDGRVSQFPRAWVSVTTADGRTGVGWMERNRNRI